MTLTLALQLAIAGISVGSIYALVALAIVIPFKSSGVLNFGQGEIVTLGAYIALVLTQLALPYPVVVASVLLLGAAGGVVIERVLIRPIVKAPEFTLIIATFAIGLLIKGVISIRFGDSPNTIDGPFGTEPIMAAGLRFNPTSLWIFLCTALVTIGTLGYYAAYAVIIYFTVLGRYTIGALTFLAGSFRQSRGLIQSVLLSLSQIYEQSLYLADLFTFFDVQPRVTSKPGARAVPKPIREGFAFENVGFRYPGSERWAVRHLTFTIRPEERVALVGENGAGKTTLVKLLARLYDPDEGRILLDGMDLREYDLESMRRNIGVIFQDFVRYEFILKENIGVSQVEALNDEARIREAARRSLADSVASRLEKGYDQMLGRRFDGGVELSGGEWQKVALGRAYMREAQVLILDEPTAALDARAEYEVFLRFAELTKGKMAVLISHRFSTVRMADRIIVLQGGEPVDQGTHEELLARGGLYAELFSLQAAGYR